MIYYLSIELHLSLILMIYCGAILSHACCDEAQDGKSIFITLSRNFSLTILSIDQAFHSFTQSCALYSFHTLDSCYPIGLELRWAVLIHEVVQAEFADVFKRGAFFCYAMIHTYIVLQFPCEGLKSFPINAQCQQID